ncbi:MAG: DUF262 domain-containing protein [Kiritimatiellae bacterium]|nr:DUF262 domain-containing protein [Kiritimatiellia bacterium]
MTIDRDTIIRWISGWAKSVGLHVADETDASRLGNYVQVIPWQGEDPYQGYVHYEVIKHNELWFAEFHMELYKSQGRDALEKKIDDVLWRHDYSRRIIRDSSYASRYWKSRCPILTEDDLKNDLALLKNLVDESKIRESSTGTRKNADEEAPVSIKTMPLLEVLADNLKVPNYQRGYCWRMEDVRRMVIDIHAWQSKHPVGIYNMGTIVLKRQASKKEVYTIIDGQQRLTTFAILSRLPQQTRPEELGEFDLGENNTQQKSIGFLVRARDILRALIGKGRKIDLNRISVNVVRLSAAASDDLAYLFFNHTNSLGRKLTDYELLKGHHLRFVDTTSQSVDCSVAAQKTVEIWNRLARPLEVSKSSKNGHSAIVGKGTEEVLHKLLFRLRKWGAGEKFSPWADDLPTHDLFHHFSMEDEPLDGVLSSARAVDYDSIVRDGPEFFNYAETYRWKFAAYLQTAAVGLLYENLKGHSNDVLFDIINALGFLFYDKFGEKYLPEALYCITYRVSEIRNKSRVMQKYVGVTDIPDISQWAMPSLLSSQIIRSNHESILFPILTDPSRDYELLDNPTPRMKAYWNSIIRLCEALEGKMEIEAVKRRVEEHLSQIGPKLK